MRVLVTGMGGELGTRVAQMLEDRAEVDEVAGFDFMPPRRRLRRARFKRIDPRDRDRIIGFVTDFAPHAVAHFGVYEPHSRMNPREAAASTEACTVNALGAAQRAGQLERIAVRSGLEVYGRGRGHPLVPDEEAPLAPTTPYGHTCLEVERLALGFGRRHDVKVGSLRYAVVAGSHIPSPLGRVLRLPAVPVPALADPAFSLLHQDDAARAMVEMLVRGLDGPLNVVGPGATSPWQAVRLGGRIPIPVLGVGWDVAAEVAELAGAPIPPHVAELLRHGRSGDGARAVAELELGAMHPTQEVLVDLYEWATVIRLEPARRVA
ncbi:MAG TPA: NAD-dependent epimerase/dehydratase family protein [Acidimicrobiia bacterium]|nr:NAD-dependent epimerase/dehydratase family protein [Acidimicrobiia bacterium]